MLPREAIGEGLTQPPQVTRERPVNAWITGTTPVDHSMHGELWLTGWQEHEDAIPQHMSPAYFDPPTFGALPEEFQFPHDFDYRLRTKAGGVPYLDGERTRQGSPSPLRLSHADRYVPLHTGTLAGPVRDRLRCPRAPGERPDGNTLSSERG
jgi:hypothetical protein